MGTSNLAAWYRMLRGIQLDDYGVPVRPGSSRTPTRGGQK